MIKGLEVDVQATRKAYEVLSEVDVSCCNACAVHVEAVKTGAFPPSFIEELERAGIDPLRPLEVWGAPDGGFLNGWFLFVGSVQEEWTGDGEGAFQSPVEGFKFWATGQLSMRPPPELEGRQLAQIEFLWENSPVLKRLDALVW